MINKQFVFCRPTSLLLTVTLVLHDVTLINSDTCPVSGDIYTGNSCSQRQQALVS